MLGIFRLEGNDQNEKSIHVSLFFLSPKAGVELKKVIELRKKKCPLPPAFMKVISCHFSAGLQDPNLSANVVFHGLDQALSVCQQQPRRHRPSTERQRPGLVTYAFIRFTFFSQKNPFVRRASQ